VWTVSVRNMLWRIVQILARVDSVVNGIKLLHFDNSVKPVDIKQPSTSASTSSENESAVATYLLSKTVAWKPSSKILLATVFIRLINILSSFARFLIKDPSLCLSRILLNAYAFREFIAPLPALAKCSSLCVMLPKLRLLQRQLCLYYAFIFRSLTKYLPNRVNIAYYWKHVAELELAHEFDRHHNHNRSIRHARSWWYSERFQTWAYRKIRHSIGFFPDQ